MCRQEAEDLLTTAVAVAAARAQAAADAADEAAAEDADIASALTAVCQVATNALEVCCAPMHGILAVCLDKVAIFADLHWLSSPLLYVHAA